MSAPGETVIRIYMCFGEGFKKRAYRRLKRLDKQLEEAKHD